VKLHIGCFDVPLDGWYNTDITPHIFVARVPFLSNCLRMLGAIDEMRYRQHQEGIFRKVNYLDATKRFPYQDNSVEAVYSSQMLVNLSRQGALRCLREVHRVLKPGGILRIGVTNLDWWIQGYDPNDPDKFLSLMYLPMTKGEKNHIHWMYNEYSLKRVLDEAGFNNIERYEMHRGECPDVEWIDYRSDAMFMEGEK
jgi:predicted SAM-dependent methyltransferase